MTTAPSTGLDWRRIAIWGLPIGICAVWLLTATVGGHWGRVASHWESTLTMIFGSFVAGSTPQGGGAVAFPVFTKVLEVPTPVARTFSLSVQAIGMTTASAIILLARRPVDRRAIFAAGGSGVAGFLFALYFLSYPDTTFWTASMSGPYVKVTFTIMLAAMSYIVFLSLNAQSKGTGSIDHWNRRVWIGFALAGFAGGIASAFTGSGVDVLLFLFAVVMCGLHPRVGVPTSIIAMALTSTVGFILLGIIDGQLNVVLDAAGTSVIQVAGENVAALPARQYDVFGLWMAAIPVIVWGAPLGAWVAHVLTERRLIMFVAGMALLEVISTAVFLDNLRTDATLILYGLVGLFGVIAAITYIAGRRHALLHLPGEDVRV